MRKLGSFAFILLLLTGTSLAQSAEDLAQYRGQILVESGTKHAGETIRTDEDFHRFQARLPPTLASKRQPALENPDPLRATRLWNPETEMLLVAIRSDTLSATPELKSLSENEEEIVATFVLPLLPPEAYPYGWGVYRGVVVPHSEKKVTFQFIRGSETQSP